MKANMIMALLLLLVVTACSRDPIPVAEKSKVSESVWMTAYGKDQSTGLCFRAIGNIFEGDMKDVKTDFIPCSKEIEDQMNQ